MPAGFCSVKVNDGLVVNSAEVKQDFPVRPFRGDFELAVIPHHFNEIREPDPGKTAFRAERNRDPAFKRGCFPPFPFVAAA